MTKSKNTKVVVVGLYNDPKTAKPVPIGKEITVPNATAEIGLAASVFAAEGTVIGESAPADTAQIENLKAEIAELTEYKGKVEALLKAGGITFEDLEKEFAPDPKETGATG